LENQATEQTSALEEQLAERLLARGRLWSGTSK
jgi:hypothetical protein